MNLLEPKEEIEDGQPGIEEPWAEIAVLTNDPLRDAYIEMRKRKKAKNFKI